MMADGKVDLFILSSDNNKEDSISKFLEVNLPSNIKVQMYDETNWNKADYDGVPFVVLNAQNPKNESIMRLANQLYDDGCRPYIIVTDADMDGAFTEVAENLFPNFWGNKNSALSDAELYFTVFYYSSKKGKLDIDSLFDIKGNGISLIVEAVEKDYLFR